MAIEEIPKVTLADLTVATLSGTGVFDTLMRAAKAHLDQEYTNNRIKGADYATVYLGSMTQVMAQSVAFLLAKDKAQYDAQIAEAQVRLTEAQILLVQKQIEREDQEAELRAAQAAKLRRETLLLDKQEDLMDQEILSAIQGVLKSTAEVALMGSQAEKVAREVLLMDKQEALMDQEILSAIQGVLKSTAEVSMLGKQEVLIDKQIEVADQSLDKGVIEITNLGIQSSLLNAQINLTTAQKTSTDAQSALVIQKTLTEKAQTLDGIAAENSVVGKQKNLYAAQTNGYLRDSEQRAAKLLADTWVARRTTDEGTVADGTNLLNDATIGLAITKLLAGIGITP